MFPELVLNMVLLNACFDTKRVKNEPLDMC